MSINLLYFFVVFAEKVQFFQFLHIFLWNIHEKTLVDYTQSHAVVVKNLIVLSTTKLMIIAKWGYLSKLFLYRNAYEQDIQVIECRETMIHICQSC